MHLRPYQTQAIEAIRTDWKTYSDVVLVMATGGGKTQTFLRIAMDAADADPNARILVIAHRKELVDQPLDRIRLMDASWLQRNTALRPRVGVITDGRADLDRQLTAATVQSLSSKRVAALLANGAITHLITDECHHACAPSYMRVYQELKAAYPELRHLGVTATPQRGDGDGLAKVYQKDSAKVTIADLVKGHYLVQPRWLGISTGLSLKGVGTSNGDFNKEQLAAVFDTPHGREIIVTAYQQYASGRQFIAFTAGVQGAHDLADSFNALGIKTLAIDGKTPKDVRARILESFRKREIQGLVNCQVLTEGFDAPGTNCIIMGRPTKSDSLYVQCVGRGLRPANGMAVEGEDCLILDFLPAETRNIVMAGDVLGLPKDKTKAVDELLKEDSEPGEVQVGFTFDGEDFHTSGTPLEIIARQLDYLNTSPFRWHRYDGWLTLGLGLGSDENERILAVPPAQDGTFTLYAVGRKVTGEKGNRVYGAWRARPLMQSEDIDEIGNEATAIAERWGANTLISKGRAWLKEPATDPQMKYLKRTSKGALKWTTIKEMTKGECGAMIDHYQARESILRHYQDASTSPLSFALTSSVFNQ